MTHVANPSSEDIFIVGIGAVTPVGTDARSTWRALAEGKSGIGPIRLFDARGLAVRIAGEADVEGPYTSDFLGRPVHHRKERLAAQALDEAMASAGLSRADLEKDAIGLFSGSEKAVRETLDIIAAYDQAPPAELPSIAARHHRSIIDRYADAFNQAIAERLPSLVVSINYAMACAASAVALVQAVRWLRRGMIDRAIVIGVDTPVNTGSVIDFHALGALSTRNSEPSRASRPFDAERDGFILAEGAGAVILESGRIAGRRGGRTFARITGVGITNNQDHITKTPRSGAHAARAIQLALEDANLDPSAIGYINAHATSTDIGDVGETNAILEVFPSPPPVSGTKSMTGHLIAAAGIVALIITSLSLQGGFLPPTINQDHPDPDCPLDCIANRGRPASVDHAIVNAFGFGGSNVTLVVSR